MTTFRSLLANNPLEVVLDNLDYSPEPITLKMLEWVSQVLAKFDYRCETYAEVVYFLEMMESHGLIDMSKGKSGTYTIRKIGYNT